MQLATMEKEKVVLGKNEHNHGHFSDNDECNDGTNNCDGNAVCDNTVGSFTCTCQQGYSGDGVNCEGKTLPAMLIYFVFICQQQHLDSLGAQT